MNIDMEKFPTVTVWENARCKTILTTQSHTLKKCAYMYVEQRDSKLKTSAS